MSDQERIKVESDSSLMNYVENLIEKHPNQLDEIVDEDVAGRSDKQSLVSKIENGNSPHSNFDNRTSKLNDADYGELILAMDSIVKTRENAEKIHKQQVRLRQNQPPKSYPVDIQVQEVYIKPQRQHSPVHVHLRPKKSRDQRRRPSSTIVKSTLSDPPPSSSGNQTVFYNKYVPVNKKSSSPQIVIHHHSELPLKSQGPFIVERCSPSKPSPKRHIDRQKMTQDASIQNPIEAKHNRYIEHKKAHASIEVEIIRLPVIKLNPEEYEHRSNELAKLDSIRSSIHDSDIFQWRI